MKVLSIILAIIAFGFLVVIHEFGHYIAARFCGVKVDEFAVGMGPKLISKKGKNTIWSIRLLPIGGFCAMQGESAFSNPGHDDEEEKSEDLNPEESFINKKPWQRFLILFSGPAMNLILGIILTFCVFIFAPSNKVNTTIFANDVNVGDTTISENAKLLEINDWNIYSNIDVSSALMFAGDTVTLKIKEDSKVYELEAPLSAVSDSNFFDFKYAPKSFSSICDASVRLYKTLSQNVILSLKYLIKGTVSVKEITGPVGITKAVADATITSVQKTDFTSLIIMLALLTINLGMCNLLPIPALDGGHILFLIIEKIKRKPVSPKVKECIALVCIALLFIFMFAVTIKDIINLF